MRIFVASLFFSFSALAHQSTLTSGGTPIRWPGNSVTVSVSPSNSDMTDIAARNIIEDTLAEWNQFSPLQLDSGPSNNTISFLDDFSEYGPGVVGVTAVTFGSGGTIQKAQIFLNDEYNFRTTPGIYNENTYFLGDVVTHELGHLSGLSHSEVLDSTMFYTSYSGQSSLSADDKAGVRRKYASASYGKITGIVKGGNDVGVFGVHVQAISRKTGGSISAITDEDGKFVIGGLEPEDTFYLYTSPLKELSALPAYFANVQSDFCPGNYVGSFFSACGPDNEGHPQGIHVTSAASTVDVGTITINCSLRTNEEYDFRKLQGNFTPLTVYDYGVEPRDEKAFVGHFRVGSSWTWTEWDKLAIDLRDHVNMSGSPLTLKVNPFGQKFGNQLEYQLEVYRNNVLVASDDMELLPVEKTYRLDLTALVSMSNTASQNVFEVRVRARRLSNDMLVQSFPSFDQFTSSKYLPYLLVASLGKNTGELLLDAPSNLSDNASCLDAPFTFKVNKATSSGGDIAETSASGAAAAGCGTIEPPQNGGGSGPQAMAMLTGFFLSLLASLAVKRSKKVLS